MALTELADEGGVHLPVPPAAIGLIALGVLILLLVMTLMFGKGRPHA